MSLYCKVSFGRCGGRWRRGFCNVRGQKCNGFAPMLQNFSRVVKGAFAGRSMQIL
jgi:hypothetical protein